MPNKQNTTNHTPLRKFRLSDADWAALERIAIDHGFDWGGIPSRSEAVRFLIRSHLERGNGAEKTKKFR